MLVFLQNIMLFKMSTQANAEISSVAHIVYPFYHSNPQGTYRPNLKVKNRSICHNAISKIFFHCKMVFKGNTADFSLFITSVSLHLFHLNFSPAQRMNWTLPKWKSRRRESHTTPGSSSEPIQFHERRYCDESSF